MKKKRKPKPAPRPAAVAVAPAPPAVALPPAPPIESLPPALSPTPPVIVNHPWTGDGARAKGLRCPKCLCIAFSDGKNVRDTDRIEGAIRRYRVCRNCGKVWTTIER